MSANVKMCKTNRLYQPNLEIEARRASIGAAQFVSHSHRFLSSRLMRQGGKSGDGTKGPCRRATIIVRAVDSQGETSRVLERNTGILYPLVMKLGGVEQRCLGVGHLHQSWLGLIPFNQMSVGFYVNPDLAAKELGIRARSGLDLVGQNELCDVLLNGAFTKSLVFQTARNLSGEEFSELLYSELQEKMKFISSDGDLAHLISMFEDQELREGTEVALVWKITGDLQVVIREPASSQVLEDLAVDPSVKTIHSNPLCRGIFELYLGERALSNSTKSSVAEGALKLLESDRIGREYRKRSIFTEKGN